jgi:hypothetical protein
MFFYFLNNNNQILYIMDLSAEEIQKNIAALKNKVGDARTGGKGSQRRKVKVVSKQAVKQLTNLGWR